MRPLTLVLIASTTLMSAFSSGCLVVAATSCTDGVRNGLETDVDCGGGDCAPCGKGLDCVIDADCTTDLCAQGFCAAAPTCTDGIQNGDETGVDCGGTTCPFCFLHHNGAGGDFPAVSANDVFRLMPGSATSVNVGTEAGYGITGNVGGSFRLVWTGDGSVSGQYHEFYGSVFTTGSFTSITNGCADGACALQSDDYVSIADNLSGGQRIDFDSIAASTLNGFDFVSGGDPVYFDLYIDGQHYPDLVYFPATDNGGAISPVADIPFGLTLN